MKKISIIIPAYNEESRIGNTLIEYYVFFKEKRTAQNLEFELLVVINGTTDSTEQQVCLLQEMRPELKYIVSVEGGKGLAIKKGFEHILVSSQADYIGYVDADMATTPYYFFQLYESMQGSDGAIASRYMPGASVTPPRPFIKRVGSKIFFETLTKLLFGINYYDTQCGAKLFRYHVIKKINPYLTIKQWAFDVELLYLCKKFGFKIVEIPTVWSDQSGSKLQLYRAGTQMLKALITLRWQTGIFKK